MQVRKALKVKRKSAGTPSGLAFFLCRLADLRNSLVKFRK